MVSWSPGPRLPSQRRNMLAVLPCPACCVWPEGSMHPVLPGLIQEGQYPNPAVSLVGMIAAAEVVLPLRPLSFPLLVGFIFFDVLFRK